MDPWKHVRWPTPLKSALIIRSTICQLLHPANSFINTRLPPDLRQMQKQSRIITQINLEVIFEFLIYLKIGINLFLNIQDSFRIYYFFLNSFLFFFLSLDLSFLLFVCLFFFLKISSLILFNTSPSHLKKRVVEITAYLRGSNILKFLNQARLIELKFEK